MTQFAALIWLKWTLFRNSMRSRRAAVSRVASMLGTLSGLALALGIASVLGVATYAVASLDPRDGAAEAGRAAQTGSLFLLTIFAVIYLMWAIVPLGIGGGNQFDPGRLLLYPVSLRKLFAIDLLSELGSLASIFAVPIVFAIALGAGLASGNISLALVAALCAILFGIAFAKLLATSVGALTRKRRTRGETLLALLGALAGLAGAFIGQLAPYLASRADSLSGLRWTPPGAAAVALMGGLRPEGTGEYAVAVATLAAYALVFVAISYRVARRAALGMGGARRPAGPSEARAERYTGWQLPFLSSELSAVVEKEWRYAVRNAQLRMVALMPLILIGVRLMQGRRTVGDRGLPPEATAFAAGFALYGEGLFAAGGVLYVFTILSALSCNLFAYEGGGMRTLMLAPLDRRTILVGKNIVVTFVAFVLAVLLIAFNQIVFRDLSLGALSFAALCFLLFAALFALVGNWLSIYFPKRLQFGKRMNASGVTGLLVIPMMLSLAVPPLLATAAGYLTRSLVVKYATLAVFAGVAVMLYGLLITRQGRTLARREFDILEAVSGQTDD